MLDHLPVEIVELVLDGLRATDLCSLNLTNRRLRSIVMPRCWNNLEFTMYKKDHPEGIGRSQWVSAKRSCMHMFDTNTSGVWTVIGSEEIADFVSDFRRKKLNEQLGHVRGLNFDQQVMYDESQQQKKSTLFHFGGGNNSSHSNSNITSYSGYSSRWKPEMAYTWIKNQLMPESFPKVDIIRIRINRLSSLDDQTACKNLISRFGVRTGIVTTGYKSILQNQSITKMGIIKMVDLNISGPEEFPIALPKGLLMLELWSSISMSIDASLAHKVFNQVPSLGILSIINVSFNNPKSIRWIPDSVRSLSLSVRSNNFLEGRLGEVVEYPNVEVFTVGEAHGFIKKIMPTSLKNMELNYTEMLRGDDYEYQLIKRNSPCLRFLSLKCPGDAILDALNGNDTLEVLEIFISPMKSDLLERLGHLQLFNLQNLSLVFHECNEAQMALMWSMVRNIPTLSSLRIVHFEIKNIKQFASKYQGLYKLYAYWQHDQIVCDFVMDLSSMRAMSQYT